MSVEYATLPRMTEDDSNTVQGRLRRTREAFGMSQASWCRLVGIDPPAWNNYESGLRRISIDQAMKVCQVTGVSMDWIYRGLMSGLPVDLVTRLQDRTARRR